jgi:hypothetical protein
MRRTPIAGVERDGVGAVVFFASSGFHGSAEYVRDCGTLAFDLLSVATSEVGDEEEHQR